MAGIRWTYVMLDRVAAEELSTRLHVEQLLSPRNNDYIRISSIGECRRKIGYRLLSYRNGEPQEPIWAHALGIFDFGNGMHHQMHLRLGSRGLGWVDSEPIIDGRGRVSWAGNCELEVKSDRYRLAGHLDELSRPLKRITRVIDGQQVEFVEPTDEADPAGRRALIDYKTITARDRLVEQRNPKTGELLKVEVKLSAFEKLKAPKSENLSQASLYAFLTTQPEFKTDRIPEPLKEIPDVMIVYIAKDLAPDYYEKHPEEYPDPKGLLNAPYKVFVSPVDLEHVNALLKKSESIWKAIDAGKLPPRDYHHRPERPAWACCDCSYRKSCYQKEGYFQDEKPALPARLQYRLSQVNPDLIVLD
jgi:hypothetical protein